MPRTYGQYSATWPLLGKAVFHLSRPWFTLLYAWQRMFRHTSRFANTQKITIKEKLAKQQTVYLLGIAPSGHNAGAALVEVCPIDGVRVICNEEEERYRGIKHYTGYPESSIAAIIQRMAIMNLKISDIHACLASWCYMDCFPFAFKIIAEHFPASIRLANPRSCPKFNHIHILEALKAPRRLGQQLGLKESMPIIAMPHHDNHAYFSFAVSPFSTAKDPVMITVIDGFGDKGSISWYVAKQGNIRCIYRNHSMFDSLGVLYSIISSSQGGWTTLSSEGRYMGAAAWGDGNRLTNPYYRYLRQLIYFEKDGRVYINRKIAGWHKSGELKPYTAALKDILGEPVATKDMWNPDAVLSVEDIEHSPVTQERVDKAAATQLVFEDMLFHIVEHLILTTGSDKLILTGGTALNCVANMHLLENFNKNFYKRYLGQNTHLNLWIPPTPGDAGVAMGAAYAFALTSGAKYGPKLAHAFYCGLCASSVEICKTLEQANDIEFLWLGNIHNPHEKTRIVDFMADVISNDGILGLFQGAAETGPRALGHRSILANPCNPNTLDNLNRMVKFRERIRPLAPMATYEAALELFDLQPGAADDEHNAYNYMVLTARAKPHSYQRIPAVIHHDGTSRVQIVRRETDPFTHAFLKAMGQKVGVEAAVNTSLNVGSPIVQSPEQALRTLKRAKGMSGLVMIGKEGDTFLACYYADGMPNNDKLFQRWKEWEKANHTKDSSFCR